MSEKQTPVAWLVRRGGCDSVMLNRTLAEHRRDDGCVFEPLYRSLALTDVEREAIETACVSIERDDRFYENEAASLRATLERLLERTK